MRYHPASVPETLPVSTGGHWASKSSGLSGTNNAGSAVTAATSLRLKNSTAVLLISGEMYIQPDTFSLDDFVKSKGATGLELEIIKTYFELDPEIRRTAFLLCLKNSSNR